MVTGLALLLFVGLIAWSWHDRSYNPDESSTIVVLREVESLWEFRDQLAQHFGANVQFYLVSHMPGFGVPHLQFVAAVMVSLALFYAVWVGLRYRLFTQWSVLALVAVVALNDPVHHFGTWGLFNYGQAILVSVLILHVALMLARRGFALGWPTTMALGVGLGVLVVNYGANVMPIVLGIGAAALWALLPKQPLEHDGRARAGIVVGRAAVLLAIVGAFTAVTLQWLAHGEFDNPRQVIHPLFFPLSDFEQSWRGMVQFTLERSQEYAVSTWIPNRSLSPYLPVERETVAAMLAVIFVVGMLRSLVQWRRLRFVIALMLLAALGGLVVLSLRGTYAFGFVRYALFIHGPILLMTALGVCDLFEAGSAVVRRLAARGGMSTREQQARLRGHLRVAAYAVSAVLVIGWQFALMQNVAGKAVRFNQNYERIVGLLRATDAPWILTDTYSQSILTYVGIEYTDRDTFFLDRPFLRAEGQTQVDLDELEEQLDEQERVLTVTYWPIDRDEFYEPVRHRLETRFERVMEDGVNRLRVVDWGRLEDVPLAPSQGGEDADGDEAEAARPAASSDESSEGADRNES